MKKCFGLIITKVWFKFDFCVKLMQLVTTVLVHIQIKRYAKERSKELCYKLYYKLCLHKFIHLGIHCAGFRYLSDLTRVETTMMHFFWEIFSSTFFHFSFCFCHKISWQFSTSSGIKQLVRIICSNQFERTIFCNVLIIHSY